MPVVYEAKCNECGKELEVTDTRLDSSSDLCIKVDPCDDCMAGARAEGLAEGLDEAGE